MYLLKWTQSCFFEHIQKPRWYNPICQQLVYYELKLLNFSKCKNKIFLLMSSRLSEPGDSSLFSNNYFFFNTNAPHIYTGIP